MSRDCGPSHVKNGELHAVVGVFSEQCRSFPGFVISYRIQRQNASRDAKRYETFEIAISMAQ